ncbi:MAG: hypothetical protein CL666_03915 [Balneola sp.]|nr:hypothetical protein [Balneola sp.]
MENAKTSVIEADRDLAIAKSEVEAEIRIYRVRHEEQVKEYNRTISTIKQKIKNESDSEIRVDLENQLDEYEDSLSTLKREMDNYKASGRDNWDEFKDSFSNRMDNLGNSLENFFSPPNTTTSSN